MQDLPHRYQARARAAAEGEVTLESGDLPPLASTPPPEFGGPPGRWSPETLLVAAVADCFVLTFRAVARASKLDWQGLECDAEGTLDRVERVMRFTGFRLRARLTVPPGTDAERARRCLEKAERGCLVTRSLAAPVELEVEVHEGAAAPAGATGTAGS